MKDRLTIVAMKDRLTIVMLMSLLLTSAFSASSWAARQDAIWARFSPDPITLNGVMNEPAWAAAESIIIRYAHDAGIPGSGWKPEGGVDVTDSTYAVLKLLMVGNQMYLGAKVHDQSVGGSQDFNRFDGFLMALKDHASPDAPKPPAEYFYAWWYPLNPDPQPAGQSPAFMGRWGGSPREPEDIANWDAVTVVQGLSNSDTVLDTGYTVEMRFNLTPMGYNVTRNEGDVVEWNISIYDCDWWWPNHGTFSSNRVWWQQPWGNQAWYDEVHVFAKPSVTVFSGPLPNISPEWGVLNGVNYPTPVIDGSLTDAVWSHVPSFDIRYGDSGLRATYPGVGPYRAGQYQATVNGGQAAVVDPLDATVRVFFKGDILYLGFDVRDQVVQYHANFDRWDGSIVTINDRVVRNSDQVLVGRRLTFQVAANGTALAQDYLPTLISQGGTQLALTLKPGTTVDTLGLNVDTGYYAELAIDLTKLGYPSGLGDRVLFLGIDMLDGDSFVPASDSYGVRTWWFRQYEGECCPVWAYLDPTYVTGVDEPSTFDNDGLPTVRSFPNPGSRTTLHYRLAEASDVTLEVFDVQGRSLEKRFLGRQEAGSREAAFDGSGLQAGLYLYRLRLVSASDGHLLSMPSGRLVVVR